MAATIVEMSASELHREFLAGSLSACEIVEAHLAAIESANADINAFLHIFGQEARTAADEQDARFRRGGRLGPLAGVPIAIKDNILVQGGPTTCGTCAS